MGAMKYNSNDSAPGRNAEHFELQGCHFLHGVMDLLNDDHDQKTQNASDHGDHVAVIFIRDQQSDLKQTGYCKGQETEGSILIGFDLSGAHVLNEGHGETEAHGCKHRINVEDCLLK